METAITTTVAAAAPAAPITAADQARINQALRDARASNTRRQYRSACGGWGAWCADHGHQVMPADHGGRRRLPRRAHLKTDQDGTAAALRGLPRPDHRAALRAAPGADRPSARGPQRSVRRPPPRSGRKGRRHRGPDHRALRARRPRLRAYRPWGQHHRDHACRRLENRSHGRPLQRRRSRRAGRRRQVPVTLRAQTQERRWHMVNSRSPARAVQVERSAPVRALGQRGGDTSTEPKRAGRFKGADHVPGGSRGAT